MIKQVRCEKTDRKEKGAKVNQKNNNECDKFKYTHNKNRYISQRLYKKQTPLYTVYTVKKRHKYSNQL